MDNTKIQIIFGLIAISYLQHKNETNIINYNYYYNMKKIRQVDVKNLLEGNGWMSEEIISKKLDVPILEVDSVLKKLERDGLVESRLPK